MCHELPKNDDIRSKLPIVKGCVVNLPESDNKHLKQHDDSDNKHLKQHDAAMKRRRSFTKFLFK